MNKLQLIRKNTNLSWIYQFLQHTILDCLLKERITKKIQAFPSLYQSEDKNLFQMVAYNYLGKFSVQSLFQF